MAKVLRLWGATFTLPEWLSDEASRKLARQLTWQGFVDCPVCGKRVRKYQFKKHLEAQAKRCEKHAELLEHLKACFYVS